MQQGILNSLDQIRCFWHDLLDGNVEAMRKVDEPTVKALELKAPGSSTLDAQTIQRQLGGAQIFNAFSDQDRSQILERLRRFKDLIPSFHTFFRNLCYWEACVDSMRHLITPLRGDTIFTAFERQFTGVNQQEGQVRIQVDEANFIFASRIHGRPSGAWLSPDRGLRHETLLGDSTNTSGKGRLE